MTNKIIATFIKKRTQDSGSSNVADFTAYVFRNIRDENEINYGEKWIKETSLLRAFNFQSGKEYVLTLSGSVNTKYDKMPFPRKIDGEGETKIIKGGNSIVNIDKNNNETDVTLRFGYSSGIDRYNKAALNKLIKGTMTKELLIKMNLRGVFFRLSSIDPQDKRKHYSDSYGICFNSEEGNTITIKKESKEEIDKSLEYYYKAYITIDIRPYFKVIYEVLKPKKR